MFVYPRLPSEIASQLYESSLEVDLVELRSGASTSHPSAGYYATGSRVPETKLESVQTMVREFVDGLGFPEPKRRQEAFAQFDHYLPALLCEQMQIVPADAADEGVWSFIGLVLLPEVAVWRYPNRARERILGLPRNALRRLWWRGFTLGSGEGDPPAVLGEDQLVAVMERPTIGGDRRLAREFCRAVIAGQNLNPAESSMFIMRESAKRLMRLTPFITMGALDDSELSLLMDETVGSALKSLAAKRR